MKSHKLEKKIKKLEDKLWLLKLNLVLEKEFESHIDPLMLPHPIAMFMTRKKFFECKALGIPIKKVKE